MLKVDILGTVPASRRLARFDDPSYEIWVCSPGNSQQAAAQHIKRITRWFELHGMSDMLSPENHSWVLPYFDWLSKQDFPIYMQEPNDSVPKALVFPRKALVDRWGANPQTGRRNWFTSSITWMMAYAMHLGATEIGIFGVNMAATDEHYTLQKAGCLRFMEIAREMGIKIVVPLESSLATDPPQYGYAEASNMGRSFILRSQEMKANITALQQQIKQQELQCAFFQGAYEEIEFTRRTWVDGGADAEIDDAGAVLEAPFGLSPPTASLPTVAPITAEQYAEKETVYAQAAVPTAADFADNPDAAELLPPRKLNGAARHRRAAGKRRRNRPEARA